MPMTSTEAAEASLPAPDAEPSAPVSAGVFARAMRGFSCVFWGIPLSVLLFAGAIDLRLPFTARAPAYVFGIFLVYCGVVYFQRTVLPVPRWESLVRELLFVLLIEVYLSPFVFWWRHMPHVPYYVANILILRLCTTWGLFILNHLAVDIARLLRDRLLAIEAQVCAWLALVIMLVPTGYALLQSVLAARSFGISLAPGEAIGGPHRLGWVYAVALIPFTLTMMIAWTSKERCLRALQAPTDGSLRPNP